MILSLDHLLEYTYFWIYKNIVVEIKHFFFSAELQSRRYKN